MIFNLLLFIIKKWSDTYYIIILYTMPLTQTTIFLQQFYNTKGFLPKKELIRFFTILENKGN